MALEDAASVGDQWMCPGCIKDSTMGEDNDEEIYCVCRQSAGSRFMICCDACNDWFHGGCVGINEVDLPRISNCRLTALTGSN